MRVTLIDVWRECSPSDSYRPFRVMLTLEGGGGKIQDISEEELLQLTRSLIKKTSDQYTHRLVAVNNESE